MTTRELIELMRASVPKIFSDSVTIMARAEPPRGKPTEVEIALNHYGLELSAIMVVPEIDGSVSDRVYRGNIKDSVNEAIKFLRIECFKRSANSN